VTTFSSRNQSTAVVPADRDAIWKILSDPSALASITPMVTSITAEGDEWTWKMSGVAALGVSVAPTFTEQMGFTEGTRIDFRHDPPAKNERAGVNGTYDLADAKDGATELRIDLTMCVELPLPRAARRAVEKVMASSMARTGERFARNLYERLGLDPDDAASSIVS
jgi:carbon monoxide dehydrogenase subunit G